MRGSRIASALVLVAASLARAGSAAEPSITMISTGYLLDGSDKAVDQIGIKLRVKLFKLSDRVQDELAEWDSGDCTVDVLHGYYTVALGKDCGTALVPSKLPTDDKRYLEVTIGGTVLSPRMLVGTVPTAATASNAQMLGGKTPTQIGAENDGRYVRAQTLASSAAQAGDIVLDGTVKATTLDGALDVSHLTGSIPDTLLASNGTFAKLGADNAFSGHNTLSGDTSMAALAVSGQATFAGAPSFAASGGAPFTVGSGTKVATLNADRLDDLDSADFVQRAATAGGDLTGTYATPTVARLQGLSVSATAPTNGQHLVWSGSQWAPAAAVATFNGRTGAVAPQNADYAFAQVSGTAANTQLTGPLVTSLTVGPGLTVSNPGAVGPAILGLDSASANTWAAPQTFNDVVNTPGLSVASKVFDAGKTDQTFPLFYLQWDQANWGNNMVVIEIFYSHYSSGGYWKGMAQAAYGGEPTIVQLEATGTYVAPTVLASTLVSASCGSSAQRCNKSALVQLALPAYYRETVRLTTPSGFTTTTTYQPRLAW